MTKRGKGHLHPTDINSHNYKIYILIAITLNSHITNSHLKRMSSQWKFSTDMAINRLKLNKPLKPIVFTLSYKLTHQFGCFH